MRSRSSSLQRPETSAARSSTAGPTPHVSQSTTRIRPQTRPWKIVGAREVLEEEPSPLQVELLHRQRGAIGPGPAQQRVASEGLAELLVGYRHSRSSPRTRSESKTSCASVLAARRW